MFPVRLTNDSSKTADSVKKKWLKNLKFQVVPINAMKQLKATALHR